MTKTYDAVLVVRMEVAAGFTPEAVAAALAPLAVGGGVSVEVELMEEAA